MVTVNAGGDTGIERCVVAVVLGRGNRIGLLKRSTRVAHDVGLWHCVTGYLDPENSPREQAVLEVLEETGIVVLSTSRLVSGPAISIDDASGKHWIVHTFRLPSPVSKLQLDWEHEAYQWVQVDQVDLIPHVSWLPRVLEALGFEGFVASG